MFVLLNRVVHVVCLRRGGRDSLGFPGLSNVKGTPLRVHCINERFRRLAFIVSLVFVKLIKVCFVSREL